MLVVVIILWYKLSALCISKHQFILSRFNFLRPETKIRPKTRGDSEILFSEERLLVCSAVENFSSGVHDLTFNAAPLLKSILNSVPLLFDT